MNNILNAIPWFLLSIAVGILTGYVFFVAAYHAEKCLMKRRMIHKAAKNLKHILMKDRYVGTKKLAGSITTITGTTKPSVYVHFFANHAGQRSFKIADDDDYFTERMVLQGGYGAEMYNYLSGRDTIEHWEIKLGTVPQNNAKNP